MTWISGQKCINGLVIQAVEMKMELMSILQKQGNPITGFGLYLFDLSILAVPEETVSGLRNDSGAKYKDCEKMPHRKERYQKQYL